MYNSARSRGRGYSTNGLVFYPLFLGRSLADLNPNLLTTSMADHVEVFDGSAVGGESDDPFSNEEELTAWRC